MTRHQAHGFTLVEMAVVVAVIGLLLGSVLVPLATQIEERRISEARRLLDEAREALMGFAIIHARLPCPASTTSNGFESPAGGICTNGYDGFLPAATLGLTPTDDRGYAIDPWGNRIRYAVTNVPAGFHAFTTTNGMITQFLLGNSADLQVCTTGAGVTGTPPSCAAATALTTNAPAVIYSVGPNGRSGGTGVDEAQNPNPNSANNDRLFVSRPPGTIGAAGGEFDDIVTWLSPNILFNRLVAAGRLP